MFKYIKTLILIIFLNIISIFNVYSYENIAEKTFIITAYYSPLPDQEHYITWSYQWDVKLNWNWVHTASWKPVFEWLLAWPKNYPFWTKIYFKEFGIWSIEDRWWAIVKTGVKWQEYDRIDIWMWYWDEWLTRAKKWWRRKVKGIILIWDIETTIELNKNKIYRLTKEIWPNSSLADIIILQELFKEVKLYDWKIDWKYDSIKDTIINFQIKNNIIKNKDSYWAWYFWPKTKKVFLNKFKKTFDVFPIKKQSIYEYEKIKREHKLSKEHKLLLEYWDINISPNSKEDKIIKIQELFKKLWLYNWDINWKYDSIKWSIILLQKKLWLIKSEKDWWAWHFWSKTKTALWNYYNKTITLKKDFKIYHLNTKLKLTTKEKKDLEDIKTKIEEKLEEIAIKKNKDKDALKNSLIKKIDKIILTSNKAKLVAKLEYLKNIL